MTSSTHQDSPKVPERRYRIFRGPTGNTVVPLGQTPALVRGDEPIDVIPLSALLSDEVVEAAQVALERAAEEAARRGMSGLGIPAAEAKALVSLLVDAEAALQAVIEQVGGGQGA